MDASIEFLSFSPLPILQDDDWRQPGLRLHCRLKSQQEAGSEPCFDTVRISLQGAVRTRIGQRMAARTIMDITKLKKWSDFRTCSTPKYSTAEEHFVDVGFCILPSMDVHDDSQPQHPFIPSLQIVGTTYITRSDILSNQQKVDGKAEVLYWIDAEFRKQKRVTGSYKFPLEFSKISTPIQLNVATDLPQNHADTPVTPKAWPLLKRGYPFRSKRFITPKLSMNLPSGLDNYVISVTKPSNLKRQMVTIPIEVSMRIPPNCPSDSIASFMLHNGIPNCTVEAKWYTRRSFCIGGWSASSNPPINDPFAPTDHHLCIAGISIVKHKTNVSFPPFYQDRDDDGTHHCEQGSNPRPWRYSATTEVQLMLPQNMNVPTVSTELLKVNYELELKLSVQEEQGQEEGGKGKRVVACGGTMRIPIAVTAS